MPWPWDSTILGLGFQASGFFGLGFGVLVFLGFVDVGFSVLRYGLWGLRGEGSRFWVCWVVVCVGQWSVSRGRRLRRLHQPSMYATLAGATVQRYAPKPQIQNP